MRRVFVLLGLAGLMSLIVIAAFVAWDNPKARVSAVQKCFEQMPNVRITYISDLTKQASQSITAYVQVDGKGRIGFTGLSTSSFEHISHIYLKAIGPYGFRSRELIKGREYYGYAIDVGPQSPIPAARRLGITSIGSAVSHYDDLFALVAGWPLTTNEWPSSWPAKTGEWSKTSDEEIHFPDLPRGDYYFCLKRAGDTKEQEWPPNYPKASQ